MVKGLAKYVFSNDEVCYIRFFILLFMGNRDSIVVRALAFHQRSPVSILAWCHMWVEFVFGTHPALSQRFSPGFLVFAPPQKPTCQIPIQPG